MDIYNNYDETVNRESGKEKSSIFFFELNVCFVKLCCYLWFLWKSDLNAERKQGKICPHIFQPFVVEDDTFISCISISMGQMMLVLDITPVILFWERGNFHKKIFVKLREIECHISVESWESSRFK